LADAPRDNRAPAAERSARRSGRIWTLAGLLLVGAAVVTILGDPRSPFRGGFTSPISGEVIAGLETAEQIDARPGQLRDYNVLLVTLDTTRADHLRAYGNTAIETPILDGLARRGVLFAEAVTPSPSTLPAHSSILSGLYPFRHGARANGTFRLGDEIRTLAEVMRGAGYQTGAVISAFVLDGRFGLTQGFDDYDDDLSTGVKYSRHMFRERPAELTAEVASAWLEEHAQKGRFFYWAHFFDPHATYLPPEPYRSRYAVDPYMGEIAYADERLGRLLEKLEALGVRDRTLVVVTADHGEGRGQHGEMTHSLLVYDGTLHVPLIFSAPPPFRRDARSAIRCRSSTSCRRSSTCSASQRRKGSTV
jgi:arylsulfatase A-like enzyme